jgi:molybdopterin molybdotransferase
MISLEEARALIAQKVHPLDPERVPLDTARGRVLREGVAAPEDLSAFDRSAMDGDAIGADDQSAQFRVVAEIQPGAGDVVKIGPRAMASSRRRRATAPRW